MVIYKTINLLNGKIYVGKDQDNIPSYFGSGLQIKRAIKKYGKSNFKKEIIEVCDTIEALNEREIYWIKRLDATNPKIGYNLTEGGTGGETWKFTGKKKQNLKKLHEGHKNWVNSQEGKETRRKILKDWWSIPENRTRMSEMMKGRKITWADKISKSLLGKKCGPCTEERKSRLRKTNEEKRLRGDFDPKLEQNTVDKIIKLYNENNGPKRISLKLKKEFDISVSPYIIIKELKKQKIYQKYAKGLKILQ